MEIAYIDAVMGGCNLYLDGGIYVFRGKADYCVSVVDGFLKRLGFDDLIITVDQRGYGIYYYDLLKHIGYTVRKVSPTIIRLDI